MWHPSNLPFTSSPLIYTYGILLDTDGDLPVSLKRIFIIRNSFVLAQALKIQGLLFFRGAGGDEEARTSRFTSGESVPPGCIYNHWGQRSSLQEISHGRAGRQLSGFGSGGVMA